MTQILDDQELEQDKTYHKSIDTLIEDAEIEAEIEAEKTIRSKNALLVTISLVGIALSGLIYWQVSKTTFTKETTETALPKLTEAQPAEETAVLEPEPTPVASEKTEPLAMNTTNVEPEVAQLAPVALAEKALPKEPTPIEKAPVVVPEPAKAQAPETLAVKKYIVQLGTFSVEDNAKNFLKEIEKKGFQPTIKIKSGKAKKHIVFVGGFSTKESGSQALNDLKSKGFNSVMEKLADNSYTIVLGKFSTASQAEAIRDQLSLEGFLSSTRVRKVSRMIYIVQIGAFDSLRQAKVMQKKVVRAGFNDSFIR